jgi:hypothetical protein
MKALLLLSLALLLLPPAASAQADYSHTIVKIGSVELMNRHPACNPLALAFDPVWTNNWGWTMPRGLWHGMYAGIGLGLERGGERIGAPRVLAQTAVTIGLGFGPHIRQALLDHHQTGVAHLNLPDVVYDALNRSLGSVHSRRGLVTWLAADIALSCFARP